MIKYPIHARSVAEIEQLVNVVHDLWIDSKDYFYEKNSQRLSLKIYERQPNPKNSPGVPNSDNGTRESYVITIDGVIKTDIADLQGIRFYDINEIEYDAMAKSLEILTTIRSKFLFLVETLDVTLYKT